MEAEGLGKTLESRTVSRGKCGWASLVGYTCPAQGKEGSPLGQRMERNGKVETVAEAERQLLHRFFCLGFQFYQWLQTQRSREARI